MGELFAKGGALFWVAPSGGRDRPDETGEFVVAPFDPKVLDMFKILAMQAAKPLSFYPMVCIDHVYMYSIYTIYVMLMCSSYRCMYYLTQAMYSNKLVPPPKDVSSGLGEERSGKRGPVSVHLLARMPDLGGLKDK